MLTTRIIPCLDVRDGRVVKGVQFTSIRDTGDPASCAAAYERQGADEIVILDIAATTEQRNTQVETVRAVRAELSIPLTVGGGVRKIADAERLLAAGADKVGVNSAAVSRPEIIRELATKFGRQCTVVAIDAAGTEAGGWEVVTHSGGNRTGIDVVSWAAQVAELGAGEILLTSWDRDGTRSGYDTELLAAVGREVNIPIIASGGAETPAHFIAGVRAGAHALLAASIFHFGETTVGALKASLAEAGIEVRV